MVNTNYATAVAPQSGPAPPVQRPAAVEPRAIEDSARAQTDTEDYADSTYAPSAAVLRLLRASAEQFTQVLEATKDASVAGAMSGFRAPTTGGFLDAYA